MFFKYQEKSKGKKKGKRYKNRMKKEDEATTGIHIQGFNLGHIWAYNTVVHSKMASGELNA